jgi:hypothetical protein
MSVVTKALIGAGACIAFAVTRAATPHHETWVHVALVFAALVLVPLVLTLFEHAGAPAQAVRLFGLAQRLQFPAGLALAISCGLARGWAALVLALPWMVVTALFAGAGFLRVQQGGLRRELHLLAADVALLFSAIGGAWLLADRGGFQPLGFPPQIVGLTAVHFHYAGLLVPLFAGLAQQQMWMSRLAARAVVGSVLGVPAVAVGITSTQLGWSPAIEAAAGCGMALAGMAVGVLHVRLAVDTRWPASARVLLGIAGTSIFFAMVLAALYASRAFVPSAGWLDLPQMQALHGTVNIVGFALCGAIGWRGAKRGDHSAPPL